MSKESFEIMVIAENTGEYLSWPKAEKLGFYEKVVEWHNNISGLMRQGEVIKAWGSQKVPGGIGANTRKVRLIAIYKATLDKLSELLSKDPLWDYCSFETPLLRSIEGDFESDSKVYKERRKYLGVKKGKKLSRAVTKYSGQIPDVKAGGNLEILVTTHNSPEFQNLSDVDKLDQYERVIQMHDYHNQLRRTGIIVEEWGTHQQCAPERGIIHYKVSTYDDFDSVFLADPIRFDSIVRIMTLVSFDESWKRAKQDLEQARVRLKD